MEGILDALPAVMVSSLVAVLGAGATLIVANRIGIGDISQLVDKENDRLVAKQAQRIGLLEVEVKELKADNQAKDIIINSLSKRIDDLEKLVSDQQIELSKYRIREKEER